MTMKIEGTKELSKQLEKLAKTMSPSNVEPSLLKGATVLADEIRRRAPRGPTGNLKRSVFARTMSRLESNRPAAAMAAVDRKIAPHAHLLELGTSRMGKRPFFRPAVDAREKEALGVVVEDFKAHIKGAIK